MIGVASLDTGKADRRRGPFLAGCRPHATMKFNGTAKQYALLPQSQSDDELVRPDDRHNARSPRARTASGQSDGALSLPDLASANGGPDIPRGNSKHVAPCTDHDEVRCTSLDLDGGSYTLNQSANQLLHQLINCPISQLSS